MSNFKGDDAPCQQHAEDVESQIAKPDLHPQNGDAVARMIGAQHIEVTEEDVRHSSPSPSLQQTNSHLEQTSPPKDRQTRPLHPRMGLLPPNPRQIRPRLRRSMGHARRHQPQRKRILNGLLHGAHRTTRLATILLVADGQDSSSHFYG